MSIHLHSFPKNSATSGTFPCYPLTTCALVALTNQGKLQMKLRLITLTAACAAMLATISIVNAQEPAEKDAGWNSHRLHKWG